LKVNFLYQVFRALTGDNLTNITSIFLPLHDLVRLHDGGVG